MVSTFIEKEEGGRDWESRKGRIGIRKGNYSIRNVMFSILLIGDYS